jgi:tetratricopeptide (TPR) repeat protein
MYLQARSIFRSEVGDVSDKATALRLLEQVFERDPEFVPAMTLYAVVQWYDAASGDFSDAERAVKFQLVEKYAMLAYATDPNDAVANAYHGWGLKGDGELQQAANFFERALQLDAFEMEVLRLSSIFASRIGHFEKAAELAIRLIERHPLCIRCYSAAHSSLIAAGHFDDAEAIIRQRINLVDDAGGHFWLAIVLVEQGRPQEALEIFDDRIRGDEWGWLTARPYALHDLGRHDEVQEMLERIIEGWGDEAALRVADIYAYSGDIESALAWLETAISDDPDAFTDVVWNPHFAVLHDTPQWREWRYNMEPSLESLAAIEFDIR